jgi:diadenosine tetraphosphate (Ap4A) HIT family hydrolase
MWAGWRSEYISSTVDPPPDAPDCVFCAIFASGRPDSETYVLWRGDACAALLNAFPYTSGHLMVMPLRHIGDLDELEADESGELWEAARTAVAALRAAYSPEGVNLGANLGRAAGAGVPGHLHLHALPRWNGDTNFMTSVAETRVMPETLSATWEKLREAWPR